MIETRHDPFVSDSYGGRHWHMRELDDNQVRTLSTHFDNDDLLARLLAPHTADCAGPDDIALFLQPTLRQLFPDPYSFQDMRIAAGLVLDALNAQKKIAVFADYDVDGATSAALLIRYFRAFGHEIELYIPDRLKEGYGPNQAALRHLHDTGTQLVITVDCGATAINALEEAKAIGLPVIVIDHHLMREDKPACAALINPNRPDDSSGQGHLAAAGLVYVFLAALNRLARERGTGPPGGSLPDIIHWLDLCALGTLCDMVPLRGVNRAFVRQGLKIMARGGNAGLQALASVAAITMTGSTHDATFTFGPRLNAGGRIGNPTLATRLLACENHDEARALARQLHELNERRKAMEAAILDQATIAAHKHIDTNPDCGSLVVAGEDWHPGLIGIVAGRLKDRFHRPSLVIGQGQAPGPFASGSARSVSGINIGKLIAEAVHEGIIMSGGGHAMAGGFKLELQNVAHLRSWLAERMGAFQPARKQAKALVIDALLDTSHLTLETFDRVEKLAPFGQGAPRPVFVLRDVDIVHTRPIGNGHLKINFENMGGRGEALAWRCLNTPVGDALMQRGRVHLAGHLSENTWRKRRTVQFEMIDAAPASCENTRGRVQTASVAL